MLCSIAVSIDTYHLIEVVREVVTSLVNGGYIARTAWGDGMAGPLYGKASAQRVDVVDDEVGIARIPEFECSTPSWTVRF